MPLRFFSHIIVPVLLFAVSLGLLFFAVLTVHEQIIPTWIIAILAVLPALVIGRILYLYRKTQVILHHVRHQTAIAIEEHLGEMRMQTDDVIAMAARREDIDEFEEDFSHLTERVKHLESFIASLEGGMSELYARSNIYREDVLASSEQVANALVMADEIMAVNEKISEALSLIPKITGKINLVALNATIEAARAGEAGKGFTVVAHEVKQLAKQTYDVTKGIGDHIGAGNTTVEQTTTLMKGIVDVMHNAKSIVENTNITLGDNINMLNDVKFEMKELAEANLKIRGILGKYQILQGQYGQNFHQIRDRMNRVAQKNAELQKLVVSLLEQ